jgi:hypothetical protein
VTEAGKLPLPDKSMARTLSVWVPGVNGSGSVWLQAPSASTNTGTGLASSNDTMTVLFGSAVPAMSSIQVSTN